MKISIILGLMVAAQFATAQTTTTTTTSTTTTAPAVGETKAPISVTDEQEKAKLADIDKEITNNKMRAELGANKRFSFQANVSYNGSTVEKPFSEVRPAIRSGLNPITVPASLSGTISGKYKINPNNSLGLNTGVSVNTPFHGNYSESKIENPVKGPNQKQEIDRFTVADPSLSYTYAGKLGGLMSVSSAELTYFTTSSYVDGAGMLGSIDLTQTIAGDVNGWTLGGYIGVGRTIYKADLNAKQQAGEASLSMYISPFAEYAFNDTYNFRTVFNYFAWEIAANGGQGAATALDPQQSMGLGMSITRDVYLYPNVQFMPFNLRADLTNIAVNTIINL